MLRAGLILITIWGGVGLLMPVATLVAAALFWGHSPMLHISMAEEIGELSDGILAAVGSLATYHNASVSALSLLPS